jgi:Holliday junction resolvase RusA-like endonuclease
VIRIDVRGTPAPKGSPKIQIRDGGGKPLRFPLVLPDSKASAAWARAVTGATIAAMWGRTAYENQALIVGLVYRIQRPATSRRDEPSVKPDIDKLDRNTFDAMCPKVGPRVFDDDSRIVESHTRKRYCRSDENPGALVLVGSLYEAEDVLLAFEEAAGVRAPAVQLPLHP